MVVEFFCCACGFNSEMNEMGRKIYKSWFWPLRPVFLNVVSSLKLIAGGNWKSWVFHLANGLFLLSSLVFFLIALSSGYIYIFPSPSLPPIFQDPQNSTSIDFDVASKNRVSNGLGSQCNLFDGEWVHDESYPLYNASECPFAEQGFDCLANGRKDKDYLTWRWKPRGCDVHKFDVKAILELFRGKRIVFVGDSLSRTQWESMICMLMTGVEDKRSVYEVNGNKITRQIRHLGVRFSSFDFTVEFYRSVFLVRPGARPKRAPKRVKTVLKLDKMDDISNEWVDSDILIFNTGHWWNPTKLFDMGWYFQVDGKMKLGMSITGGFKTALATWKSWAESKIDPSRTRVFFRTFESTHWSSGSRLNCKVTRQPMTEADGKDKSIYSDIIRDVVKNVSIPATALHVTPMGALRSDGHVGIFSYDVSVPDCSHWCLPGVPDAWNEMLFTLLLSREQARLP